MRAILLLVTVFTASAFAQTQSARLAPACGLPGTTFLIEDSSQDSSQQAPPAKPDPGKAEVYFIQDDGPGGDHQHYTIRIGLDGAWVGAFKHNSYFAVPVEPGEHHVCANVQSDSPAGRNVALVHFIAEPGKVYYFRTQFLAGLNTMYPIYPYLELGQPDSDQAKFCIESYPRSVSHPRK